MNCPWSLLNYVSRSHNGGNSILANTRHWTNIGLILGQRRRRRANIEPTLDQCPVFIGILFYLFILHDLHSDCHCHTKPRCSNCLVFKYTVTAFGTKKPCNCLLALKRNAVEPLAYRPTLARVWQNVSCGGRFIYKASVVPDLSAQDVISRKHTARSSPSKLCCPTLFQRRVPVATVFCCTDTPWKGTEMEKIIISREDWLYPRKNTG